MITESLSCNRLLSHRIQTIKLFLCVSIIRTKWQNKLYIGCHCLVREIIMIVRTVNCHYYFCPISLLKLYDSVMLLFLSVFGEYYRKDTDPTVSKASLYGHFDLEPPPLPSHATLVVFTESDHLLHVDYNLWDHQDLVTFGYQRS